MLIYPAILKNKLAEKKRQKYFWSFLGVEGAKRGGLFLGPIFFKSFYLLALKRKIYKIDVTL